MAIDGTSEARLAITRAAATLVPSAAPIRNASLTSPIPIPCGEIRLKTSRKGEAAQAQISQRGSGWAMVIAASTISDAGPTTRFGISRYSRSVAVTITSARQNTAAANPCNVAPNSSRQPATRAAPTNGSDW